MRAYCLLQGSRVQPGGYVCPCMVHGSVYVYCWCICIRARAPVRFDSIRVRTDEYLLLQVHDVEIFRAGILISMRTLTLCYVPLKSRLLINRLLYTYGVSTELVAAHPCLSVDQYMSSTKVFLSGVYMAH
jgi:hypothetical protein